MTPRRLDPEAVQRRLADVRTALARLDELEPLHAEALATDWMRRAAAERVVTVLVEAAVKVNTHVVSTAMGRTPETYRASFLDAADAGALPHELARSLAPSAGLRNVLVHAYDEVDLTQLATGIASARRLYTAYLEHVARYARMAGGT